jgi:hypothetical protein
MDAYQPRDATKALCIFSRYGPSGAKVAVRSDPNIQSDVFDA